MMESMKHATLVLSSCQNSNLGFLCRIESRHVSISSAAAANYKYVLCYTWTAVLVYGSNRKFLSTKPHPKGAKYDDTSPLKMMMIESFRLLQVFP